MFAAMIMVSESNYHKATTLPPLSHSHYQRIHHQKPASYPSSYPFLFFTLYIEVPMLNWMKFIRSPKAIASEVHSTNPINSLVTP